MMNILIVIAPENFNEEEFFGTKELLQKAGAQVVVANSTGRSSMSKYGRIADVQIRIKDVDHTDFDAIIFVGGSGASTYFNDEDALNIARKFFESGRLVGAICIAPTILANAGILNGKKVTAYSSQEKVIRRVATYTGNEVEQDENIITCKWPTAIDDFAKRVVQILKKRDNA